MATTTLQPTGPVPVPRGYPRPAPGRFEQGAQVIFGHARKMAARGMAAGTDFLGDVEKTFGTPGPDITPTPFRPGTVSAGAVIAKLGTSIMAAARSRANAQQRQKQQDAQMAYQNALTQDIQRRASANQDVTYTDANGVTRTIKNATPAVQASVNPPAKAPTPVRKVTLTKELFGKYKVGDVVEEPELRAAQGEYGSDSNAASRAGQNTPEIQALRAELGSLEKDISSNGPTSVAIIGQANKNVDRFAAQVKNPKLASPGDYQIALNQLGLPRRFRYNESDEDGRKVLDEAVARYKTAYWSNHFNAHVKERNPRIAELRARLATISGSSEGMPELPTDASTEAAAPAWSIPPPPEEE